VQKQKKFKKIATWLEPHPHRPTAATEKPLFAVVGTWLFQSRPEIKDGYRTGRGRIFRMAERTVLEAAVRGGLT